MTCCPYCDQGRTVENWLGVVETLDHSYCQAEYFESVQDDLVEMPA